MKNKKIIIGIFLFIFIAIFPTISKCDDNFNYNFESKSIADNIKMCLSPGDNETMLNFSWYSKTSNGKSEIKLIYKNGKYKIFKGTSQKCENGYYINRVKVTNLKKNNVYYYSYKNNKKWSKPIKYTTKDTSKFSFVFVGDPQIGASSKEDMSIDTCAWNNTLNKALETYDNCSFIISAGDVTNTKVKDDKSKLELNKLEYNGLFSPSCLRFTPITSAIGNHDKYNKSFVDYFFKLGANNLNQYAINGDTYFKYGDSIFFILNSNDLDIEAHNQFITKTLKKNKDIRWKIVVMHHNIYGCGSHSDDSDTKTLKKSMPTIFEKNNIDLVLCGHDHIYSRSYPIKSGEPLKDNLTYKSSDLSKNADNIKDTEGVIYITGGTSTGSKYYKKKEYRPPYVRIRSDKKNPIYTGITISNDKIQITAHNTEDNDIIDNFILNKK